MSSGFVTQQKKTLRKRLPSVGELDINKVTFGTKTRNKSGQGYYVPIYHDKKPLSFQCRGLFVTFAGTSSKDDNLKIPPTQRSYGILTDAIKDQCKWLPGGKGDGPALYKFQQELENLIESKVADNATAESWGCRNKVGKQMMTSIFVSAISEGTEKKDEDGKPTGEFYNPSIRFPLRVARDKTKTLVDAFTTKFNTPSGPLEVLPSTITTKTDGNQIPYGTFAILTVSYGRMWIGDVKFKVTTYVNEAQLLMPERTELVSDSFLTEPVDDYNNETVKTTSPSNSNEQEQEQEQDDDDDDLDSELDGILGE